MGTALAHDKPLSKDPMNICIGRMSKLIKKWCTKGTFENTFFKLTNNQKNINNTLTFPCIRPYTPVKIVWAINSPTYNFDKALTSFLNKILQVIVRKIVSSLRNKSTNRCWLRLSLIWRCVFIYKYFPWFNFESIEVKVGGHRTAYPFEQPSILLGHSYLIELHLFAVQWKIL